MNEEQYFLPPAANGQDLSSWHPLVPAGVFPFRTNLFGDAFFVGQSGGVHMLSRAAASCEEVSSSIDDFWRRVEQDEEGWQLRPLANACVAAGKILVHAQCYAFVRPPFLGGDYTVENVYVSSWQEWFALTADLYGQVKELPEGAQVRLNVASESAANSQPDAGFFKRLFR